MELFKVRKSIILQIFMILFAANTTLADKALVNIEFDFINIASIDATIPKGKGEGPSFIIKNFRFSTSKEGLLNSDKSKYKQIKKERDKIQEQTKHFRVINIDWKIVNYEPDNNIFSNEYKGYHLFDITWFGQRIDYILKKSDGQWEKGYSLPSTFRFGPRYEATIVGYGDVPVIIPGLSQKIDLEIGLWDKEGVEGGENYKFVISKYPIKKQLILMLSDEMIKDEKIKGQKIQLSGKATLGSSGIITEVSPFFYPFDKYSFEFIYKSYFPSDVTLIFEDIEDLNISTSKKIEFTTKGNEKVEKTIIFFRKDMGKYFWPFICAWFALFIFFFPIKFFLKKNVSLLIRLAFYASVLFSIYFTVPAELKFSKSVILKILWIFSFCLVTYFEILYFKDKKKRSR